MSAEVLQSVLNSVSKLVFAEVLQTVLNGVSKLVFAEVLQTVLNGVSKLVFAEVLPTVLNGLLKLASRKGESLESLVGAKFLLDCYVFPLSYLLVFFFPFLYRFLCVYSSVFLFYFFRERVFLAQYCLSEWVFELFVYFKVNLYPDFIRCPNFIVIRSFKL